MVINEPNEPSIEATIPPAGAPERIRVEIRPATSDNWIGIAYRKGYTGDPSAIHEYARAGTRATPADLTAHTRNVSIRDVSAPQLPEFELTAYFDSREQAEAALVAVAAPTALTERARRTVEMFNEWLVTDFRESLTRDASDALAAIIAAEFSGRQGEKINCNQLLTGCSCCSRVREPYEQQA